jgi:regulator of protease activity HflC (stomatin/prohibitin superfamily)
MFDKLVDVLLEFLHLFKFWIVCQPYEQAVLLRLGKFRRVLSSGFHWLLPFGIDYCISEHVVPTTHSLGDESVTSRDGKSVGFHAVVTYRISNIEKATLEVSDSNHAVRDATCGEIGRVMRELTWEQMLQSELPERLTAACRKRGWRYGIEILNVQLAGLALVRSIRLMQK